jgi:hypothetical protein
LKGQLLAKLPFFAKAFRLAADAKSYFKFNHQRNRRAKQMIPRRGVRRGIMEITPEEAGIRETSFPKRDIGVDRITTS